MLALRTSKDNQWIFEPFDNEYYQCCMADPNTELLLITPIKSYWIMILSIPSSVLTHLNVLSVPTDKANFPEGWIERDVTCPLIKTKH